MLASANAGLDGPHKYRQRVKSFNRNSSTETVLPVCEGSALLQFEPLLDDESAARLLGGVHIKTLQRWARNGEIPSFRVGRYWRYRASQLDAWLLSQSALHSEGQPVRVS